MLSSVSEPWCSVRCRGGGAGVGIWWRQVGWLMGRNWMGGIIGFWMCWIGRDQGGDAAGGGGGGEDVSVYLLVLGLHLLQMQ